MTGRMGIDVAYMRRSDLPQEPKGGGGQIVGDVMFYWSLSVLVLGVAIMAGMWWAGGGGE